MICVVAVPSVSPPHFARAEHFVCYTFFGSLRAPTTINKAAATENYRINFSCSIQPVAAWHECFVGLYSINGVQSRTLVYAFEEI